MIRIATHQFNPYGENTYVIYSDSDECIIVDAGCSNAAEQAKLAAFITSKHLVPIMAINTHAHVDHICGVEFVKRHWGVPFALHADDKPLLDAAPSYASSMGFDITKAPVVEIDLAQITQFKLGDGLIDIIHTPGHSQGGVSIYISQENILITGDTLFRESIGRTDLPGGDYNALMNSIITKIIPLGEETKICPGHGAKSTIGHEISFNPFITEVLKGEVKYDI